MILQPELISRWQQVCLGFLCMLTTAIGLLPGQAAILSGPYAWISALLSALPLSLLFLLVNRAFKNADANDSFPQLFMKALGPRTGKLLTGLFALWLTAYLAILLRNAADRYVSTIYQNSPPEFFIILLLLLALIGALGTLPALTRTAEVFFPLLALVLALIFVMSFPGLDLRELPPPAISEIPEALSALPLITAVQSLTVCYGFLEGRTGHKEKRRGTLLLSMGLMVVTVTLLCITVTGFLGERLTGLLNFPFFVMVSNLSVFNVFQRVESAVIGLWIISDLVLFASLLFIISGCFRICLGYRENPVNKTPFLNMKNGRWLIWVSAGAALTGALFGFPDSFDLDKAFRFFVPMINGFFTLVLLPVILLIGIARKKL